MIDMYLIDNEHNGQIMFDTSFFSHTMIIIVFIIMVSITRKWNLCHMRTAKAKFCLHILAIWSVSFLFVDVFYSIQWFYYRECAVWSGPSFPADRIRAVFYVTYLLQSKLESYIFVKIIFALIFDVERDADIYFKADIGFKLLYINEFLMV